MADGWAEHLRGRHVLRPEEWAYLAALTRRLRVLGFTDTKAGVGAFANGGDYVFVQGVLDGEPMEATCPLFVGPGLALQSLTAMIDEVSRNLERRRALAEVTRG